MRRFGIAILAALALCGLCAAQTPTPPATGTPFSYSAGWDFHVNKPIGSVSYTAASLPNTFGIKGLNLEAFGFGGAVTGQSGVIGGPGLGFSGKLGNVTAILAGSLAYNSASGRMDFVMFAGVKGSL